MVIVKECDKEEIMNAIASLKLNSFMGSSNVCPNCRRNGNFGSIIKYKTENDNEYILCAWCGYIS